VVNSWAQAYKDLTDNGKYEEGKILLSHARPQGIAEERTLSHLLAQVHFYEGNYQKAFDHALSTEQKYGPNIRLTGDMVVYLYYLDAGPQFIKYLEKFKSEFSEVQEKLSDESFFWSAFNLAKLLEEHGDIAFSIRLYISLLEKNLNSERQLRVKASLLRCYAVLGNRDKVARYYRELFLSKAYNISRFCRFEQEHALMLAELYMIGRAGAEARLVSILKEADFDAQEKSLSYYDFLDILLLADADQRTSVSIEASLIPETQFFFDREIRRIYETVGNGAVELPDLYNLKVSRSMADVLRILSQCARSQDADVAAVCRRQFSMLLESIPAASQKFWQSRLPLARTQTIYLNKEEKKLEFQMRSVDLKRSAKQFKLLLLLAETKSWDCASLGTQLYGFWDQGSSFDRLRMLVKSVNENVRTLTGDGLISLDEQSLSLRPQFLLLRR